LIAVTLFAFPCIWFGWQVKTVHRRKALLSDLTSRGGQYAVADQPSLPWWRLALGDEAIVCVFMPDHATPEEMGLVHTAIPEAEIAYWAVKEDGWWSTETFAQGSPP
jgi:hypothetical protein